MPWKWLGVLFILFGVIGIGELIGRNEVTADRISILGGFILWAIADTRKKP